MAHIAERRKAVALSEDRVEREITVDAPVERVWAVLTEPGQVGRWFGTGVPVGIDLRPGGVMVLDHGPSRRFLTVIVAAEPPRRFAYRWASGHPGEVAREGNSTLVEFTLTAEDGGTRLRVVESGFADLSPEDTSGDASWESRSAVWSGMTVAAKEYAERLPA